MKPITFMDRVRYRFDNYMSKGTVALIGGLFALSLIVILVAAVTISIGNIRPEGVERPLSFSEAFWTSLMRAMDAGAVGGDTGWAFRLVMFAVTLGGLFLLSALIGILTNGMNNKLEDLRKGHSLVIENDHTVILGWSPQIFPVISELIVANKNRPKACIAILADKEKVEMEDELRTKIPTPHNTMIVCRSGNPLDLTDLEIINPHRARSIIVLSPEIENPDAQVIKIILALTNNPNRRPAPYHIVASIRDPKNLEAAQLVGRDEAQILLTDELIARITAQTCRQSGLSVVYTELLDFDGDEIYFKAEPALTGRTFGEALFAYEDSTVIGIAFTNGSLHLNPPMHTVIQPGDQVIVISQDDDTIRLSGKTGLPIDKDVIHLAPPALAAPERTLILGWNSRGMAILKELDRYVAPGSSVLVVADVPDLQAILCEQLEGLVNQDVTCQEADTTSRKVLDGLEVGSFQHVILLSYTPLLEIQDADAHTLITLLHLRDMADKQGIRFSIVSEMLDLRNRELAEVTRADDFIVSDRLISLLFSQIAENKKLMEVFTDLFDPDGSEVYLKPVEDYICLGKPVSFYTLVEAARRRGDIAIGYCLKSQAADSKLSYGVKINPVKSQAVNFSPGDRLVVLAEA